ncbi:MAG: hypothetical protein ACI4GB_07055 [Acutalibacteraceae bacterium]
MQGSTVSGFFAEMIPKAVKIERKNAMILAKNAFIQHNSPYFDDKNGNKLYAPIYYYITQNFKVNAADKYKELFARLAFSGLFIYNDKSSGCY